MTDLVIGAGIPQTSPCPTCGFPLLLNGQCKKDHKPKNKRRGRYSGKSKSEHAFGKY